ncbi:MAG: hypothetical protein M3Q23_08845 [Actinomycetota bacterium]|nr:hypothetical protein [Actinomycetota bacterium]
MADDRQDAEHELAREQPPPPGTQSQGPAHETALPDAAAGAGGAGGSRTDELMAKRRTKGLTDAEAEELGEILAEQEGKPYSSAQTLKQGPGDAG